MGSKRWMLHNGLAGIIDSRVPRHKRFVDLFSGSAAVSWHVATNHSIPVLANDLQEFCRVLAAAVLCRTTTLGGHWVDSWINRAAAAAETHALFASAQKLAGRDGMPISALAAEARSLCANAATPATAAYGGHYFSPLQAIHLDSLRQSLPHRRPHRLAALAALVQTASACAASPGHTAQPFAPTNSAGPYLRDAWSRDVFARVRQHAAALSDIGSKQLGGATTGDANDLAPKLDEGDLVFIDPPYSSVHYSRFYHVLETIAVGHRVRVAGAGRYPPPELRPRSRYSVPSEAQTALQQLLGAIAARQCGVIITFPAGAASNQLSGDRVIEIARNWFTVDCLKVTSRCSTLEGNTRNRSPRMRSEELLLSLHPR